MLVALVSRLAELGRVEEALKAARGIEDASVRANALAELVPRLAKLGRVEEALELRGGSRTRGFEPRRWQNWVEWRRRWSWRGGS